MRTLFIIPLVLMSLVSFPSWGLTMDDLVQREGIYYKKFTDIPFTGEIDEGLETGKFKNGKQEGMWVGYWEIGKVMWKAEFTQGEEDGSWVSYHSNGALFNKGEYQNGKREGVGYFILQMALFGVMRLEHTKTV